MDRNISGKRGELVALTSPCPASRSLAPCLLVSALGDSASQRGAGAPALADEPPPGGVEVGWLEGWGILRRDSGSR